jgi:hypothetical protein
MARINGDGFKSRPCVMRNCPNKGRLRVPYCATCSGNMGDWESKLEKDPLAVSERLKRLDKYLDRMLYLGNRDKEYSHVARLVKRHRGR